MKIAISTDNGLVSAHFGRCPEFTILTIKDSSIVKKEILPNPGHQPGFIPQFLSNQDIECIICGGMGMRAVGFFKELGIKTIVGIRGDVDMVAEKFLDGALQGGESFCKPGSGKGYGVEKSECDHPSQDDNNG